MSNSDLPMHTYDYIQLLSCSKEAEWSGNEHNPQQLVNELLNALRLDGYDMVKQTNGPAEYHFSRRLSEGGGSSFVLNFMLAVVCVTMAGFASGLTQGLLSLDYMEMKIKSQSGTPKEKENANKVLPIISNHHLLLVTLMLWNASATEALPIFLSALVPEYVAIIISVTLVLMFGEIIPASILTGPKQLQIAATLTPLVYAVLVLFFPIAYPIAKLLDHIIGHEGGVTMYSRRELATMMRIQHEEGVRRASIAGPRGHSIHDTMQHDEVNIIGGALKFRDMKVCEVMTPEEKCFMISVHEKLSYKNMYEIFKSGYSRIPVYDRDRNDIVGLILAKDLIFIDPEDEIPIDNFIGLFGRKPMVVWHDQALGETLQMFRQERAHMAIVRDVRSEGWGDPYYVLVGIITLEDIIEEILGTEIEDETDRAQESHISSVLRDMDLARFKTLRSKAVEQQGLTGSEIAAIVNYLDQQVPEIKELLKQHRINAEGKIEGESSSKLVKEIDNVKLIEGMVRRAEVFGMKRKTPLGVDKADPDDVLYRRGKVSNTCILILQGRVKLLRGQYEDPLVLGAWSTIGAQALLAPEGTYLADFTAFIDSEVLRFIRLTAFASTVHSMHREGWSTLEVRRRGSKKLPGQINDVEEGVTRNPIFLLPDTEEFLQRRSSKGSVNSVRINDYQAMQHADLTTSTMKSGLEEIEEGKVTSDHNSNSPLLGRLPLTLSTNTEQDSPHEIPPKEDKDSGLS